MIFITGFFVAFCENGDLLAVYEFRLVSDFLDAADFEFLAFLDDADEGGGFVDRSKSAGVEPGDAAVEDTDLEFIALEVRRVNKRFISF
jgi:hypothetical protein